MGGIGAAIISIISGEFVEKWNRSERGEELGIPLSVLVLASKSQWKP